MMVGGSALVKDYLVLHLEAMEKCTDLVACIPYAMEGIASEDFFGLLEQSRKAARIFVRVDWSVPFDTRIMERFASEAIRFSGVIEYLHAKVIWWKGFGVYIGSCNMTDRAIFENLEFGIFLTQNELLEGNKILELENFFLSVEESSLPMNIDLLNLLKLQNEKLIKFRKIRQSLSDEFSDAIIKIL